MLKTGDFFIIFSVLYSTLLHLPPVRFHCVGGCWNRTQYSCDFSIVRRFNHSDISHPHSARSYQRSARSHPYSARSHTLLYWNVVQHMLQNIHQFVWIYRNKMPRKPRLFLSINLLYYIFSLGRKNSNMTIDRYPGISQLFLYSSNSSTGRFFFILHTSICSVYHLPGFRESFSLMKK
jgi:hypothetical protein